MAEFVLDAALACKWFLPAPTEPYVFEARLLLDRIAKGEDRAHAPASFAFEVCAWLSAQGQRMSLDVEQAWRAVANLPIELHALDRELAAASFLAARRHGLAFDTAVYLALAERLVCPYLTPDDALAHALHGKTRIATPGALR